MVAHPHYGDRGEFFWCAVCERVHSGEEWQMNLWYCPTDGCHGSSLDAFEWDFQRSGGVLERRMDHWPRVPVSGKLYSFFD